MRVFVITSLPAADCSISCKVLALLEWELEYDVGELFVAWSIRTITG